MRISPSILLAAFALVINFTSALPSSTQLDLARNTGRPLPLPPERSHAPHARLVPFRRQTITADNSSIPLPPSPLPSSPPNPTPAPLDLAISYALSDSCLLYLNSVVKSSTFISCLPFSLLLTTSTSYGSLLSAARKSGSLETLNTLIAYTTNPQPSTDQCDQYFAGVASALTAKANCAADMPKSAKAKGIASDIQSGIGNYQLMREAAGITDPDTGKYCYLQAVTDPTPDDLYLWSLPAGTSLPASSTPTCSKCSSLLLNHYSESLSTTPTLNGTTLQAAINTVSSHCGAAFVTYSASALSGKADHNNPLNWGLGLVGAVTAVWVMMV